MHRSNASHKTGYVAEGRSDLSAMLAVGYDAWASRYDADMDRYGYRLPALMVREAQRYIEDRRAFLLDAGAGSGLLGQALWMAGYWNLVGLDPSPGMLRQAHAKGVYRHHLVMALGQSGTLPAHRFDAVLAAGIFKTGHAPPEAMAELVRLVRPEGIVIINLEIGPGGEAYAHMGQHLVARKQWRHLKSSAPFACLSKAAPDSKTVIHVYQTNNPGRSERQPTTT